MSNLYDTIVIGAGQAGLASAYYLQREIPGGVCRALRAAGSAEHARLVAHEGRGSVRRHDGRRDITANMKDL
jgi:cation diffusion facilitator CzcD-associated flavoprotein CzcO